MCLVSVISDDFNKRNDFTKYLQHAQQPTSISPVTREEFDKLKKEMEELKILLKAAKKYDQNTGQPDCEMESKIAMLKEVAKIVGVDLSEVFGKDKTGLRSSRTQRASKSV